MRANLNHAEPVLERAAPGYAVRTPSPPAEGGEGRGEEGLPVQDSPLSPALSPFVPRGARKNARRARARFVADHGSQGRRAGRFMCWLHRSTQFAALLWAVGFLDVSGAEPKPLVNAHAHNDYEHTRPLSDALEHGFGSVEADVWLVDGRLLVAHDRASVRPGKTLQSLYLDPLQARIAKNKGRVFADGTSLTLLVDVKSEATNTWLALRAVLQNYKPILTRFSADHTETNAVTVIVSGNRARDLMEADRDRLAAFDGRLADLDSGASRHFIPLVSDDWKQIHRGKPGEPLPAEALGRMNTAIARAHSQQRRIRFWGAPDTPQMWAIFRNAGVDLLNADDLDGLRDFLLKP